MPNEIQLPNFYFKNLRFTRLENILFGYFFWEKLVPFFLKTFTLEE